MGWDRHEIVAEVHRRGSTLEKISQAAGLTRTACSCVLAGRRWPRAEQALADFLDVPVSTLFPDRYPRRDSDSVSRPAQGRRRNRRRGARAAVRQPVARVERRRAA